MKYSRDNKDLLIHRVFLLKEIRIGFLRRFHILDIHHFVIEFIHIGIDDNAIGKLRIRVVHCQSHETPIDSKVFTFFQFILTCEYQYSEKNITGDIRGIILTNDLDILGMNDTMKIQCTI